MRNLDVEISPDRKAYYPHTVDELNAIASALDVAPGVLLRDDQDGAIALFE